MSNSLQDYIRDGLEIIIVGINPGLASASKGRHYAGSGNHFWPCMLQSGLITEALAANEDFRILDFNIGLTNICDRATRSSSDLSQQELIEGGIKLREKLKRFAPKIAVFNGKVIYQYFSGIRSSLIKYGLQEIGLQNNKGEETALFVIPSSSPRCSSFPRATDKLPFYLAIKELRDKIRHSTNITICPYFD